MNNGNEKAELSIHVIISASKYAQTKTKQNIMFENKGEAVAEYTTFRWIIISAGLGTTQDNMLLTRRKEFEVYFIEESDVEKKSVREIFKVAIKIDNKHHHQIPTKFNLKKSCHVLAWI